MAMRKNFASCRPAPLWAAALLVIMMSYPGVEANRGGRGEGRVEWCGSGREVGDKWFDGCQWCVCSQSGPRCSSSTCSSLVKQVPACHMPGQRWTDGCYRCSCRRHGITCHLDSTCQLLRQHPVPCLADQRCVCGPDGVPSCTAEVIDRNAFAAKRVHLGFSQVLEPKGSSKNSHRGRHSGIRSSRDHQQSKRVKRSVSSHQPWPEVDDYFQHARHNRGQEGSNGIHGHHHSASRVHRQHQMTLSDSSYRGWKSADQPTQELLITSDNLCQFGARWYGGSLRCFCDLDGAIACGNPVFVLAFFDDFRVEGQPCEDGHAWEEGCRVCTCQMNGVIFCRGSQNCNQRPFFARQEGNNNDLDSDNSLTELSEGSEEESIPSPSTVNPWKRNEPPVPGRCVPGRQWKRGCQHCRCTRHGRQLCSTRHCGLDEVDIHLASRGDEDREQKPLPSGNRAELLPPTIGPPLKRFRGPMMVAPKPAGLFHPPAYAKWPSQPQPVKQCGRFSVGKKYWDDCNLCLCTVRGPRCEGKWCR